MVSNDTETHKREAARLEYEKHQKAMADLVLLQEQTKKGQRTGTSPTAAAREGDSLDSEDRASAIRMVQQKQAKRNQQELDKTKNTAAGYKMSTIDSKETKGEG